MPLANSIPIPTATISFAGLTIVRRNDMKECEVLIVECPKHDLVIDIQAVTFDPKTGRLLGSKAILSSSDLDTEQNIKITVVNPVSPGVTAHINDDIEFDPEKDLGDPQDYRWLIDLEGPKFGAEKLEMKPHHTVINPKRIISSISVTNGLLYTEKRSDEKFALISLNNTKRLPQLLGRIAYRIGLDIACRDEVEGAVLVTLANPTGQPVELRKKPNTRYLITIENVCLPTEESRGGTDFRFIFDAVSNSKGERFDLLRVVENGGRGNIGRVLPGHLDFSLDSEVQACNGGRTGGP